MFTNVSFIDETTLLVVDKEGERFKINFHFPFPKTRQEEVAMFISDSFDRNFQPDKSEMVYFVLCDVMNSLGCGFASWTSDRVEERKRIGARIKEIRESKKMEARKIAQLAGIDPANLSKIEAGKYSVGVDILSKIASVIGARVEINQV